MTLSQLGPREPEPGNVLPGGMEPDRLFHSIGLGFTGQSSIVVGEHLGDARSKPLARGRTMTSKNWEKSPVRFLPNENGGRRMRREPLAEGAMAQVFRGPDSPAN
jgi:hypothetical protein